MQVGGARCADDAAAVRLVHEGHRVVGGMRDGVGARVRAGRRVGAAAVAQARPRARQVALLPADRARLSERYAENLHVSEHHHDERHVERCR